LSAPTSETGQQDLLALTPLIRRVVAARVRDPQVVDDLVQETFARLLQARPRLDDGALAPSRLPARDRTALLANEVEGANTAALAAELGSTPGAVAAQLARARAKLRVNYLLAIRGVDLPTDRCQSVLNALSAGDRRRQRALDAGRHLLDCEVCAGLSDPLTERRRALAGFLPLGLVKPVEGLRGWLRNRPAQATAGTGALVVGALLASQLLAPDPTAVQTSTPAPTTVAPVAPAGDRTLTSEGRAILPLRGRPPLSRYAGTTVEARGVRVQQVVADEGFWVGTSVRDRVWVQLTGTRESGFRVKPGEKVTFTGRMVENSVYFSRRAGVTPREGAGLLERQGYHIEVRADRLRLSR
jgi:Sigma-70 region 2